MSVSLIDGHIDDDAMTDEQIIKALRCCLNADSLFECYECNYYGKEHCLNSMIIDVIDLINRQKAEIKRLTSGKCVYLSDDETTEYCVEGPCPKYKTEEQIKTEAVKEFAEAYKDQIENCTGMFTDEGFYIPRDAVLNAVDFIRERLVGDNSA